MLEKIGIGIDIADVDQFKKIPYLTKPNFYKKLFLPSEIQYCLKYKNPYEHFAGKFAIKEAVKKAIDDRISMLDIETSYSKSKPVVNLRGNNKTKYSFLISISHEQKLAIAMVVSEKLSS
ncbi:holo-ACP synthase [Candidatus Nitrosotenuis chungbukensis]|uniref:holo-ACP synthase n=1 Tax=Candidatus Nitrosotenuis chungbukensis TaxID=1353246 RepID=UPI0005B2BC8D|nr:holo-ACP synthase [Candidatus Nitrosotenuis chungbukensis]WKT58309.1 holo-ACP synthase [Candidatus Nitrosotenuis chungbukensis]